MNYELEQTMILPWAKPVYILEAICLYSCTITEGNWSTPVCFQGLNLENIFRASIWLYWKIILKIISRKILGIFKPFQFDLIIDINAFSSSR